MAYHHCNRDEYKELGIKLGVSESVIRHRAEKIINKMIRGEKDSNIEFIEFTDEVMEMVDVSVEDVHCYYANGVLTHNCLAANFSGDNFINPILEGKDIHNYIAKQMFGYEDPAHRTKVKILNFSVLYGATEYTISRKMDSTVEAAKELLQKYERTMSRLTTWKSEIVKQARSKGMVFTYFGRPRLLYKYYSSSEPGMRAFADRTACNSPIQGCLPSISFIELGDKVIRLKDHYGKRLEARDRTVIPVHKGTERLLKVIFRSGDFLICDQNHKLIYGKSDAPMVQHLYDTKWERCWMTPLRKKKFNWDILSALILGKKSIQHVINLCSLRSEIDNNHPEVAATLFKYALLKIEFEIKEPVLAASLRSLASIYGYNIKIRGGKYRVTFTRCKKSKIRKLVLTDKVTEVGTTTVISKNQMYEAQGVWNKKYRWRHYPNSSLQVL